MNASQHFGRPHRFWGPCRLQLVKWRRTQIPVSTFRMVRGILLNGGGRHLENKNVMGRRWNVKKDHRWFWMIVCSAVGLAIMMAIMVFVGTR